MSNGAPTRREFMKQSAAIGTGMGMIAAGLTAKSYARIPGANDRIRVALIGCGGRGSWHIRWLHRASQGQNVTMSGACDVWKKKYQSAAEAIEEVFEEKPKTYQDYREVLAGDEYDAVIIATCDHQHCTMLREAVQAGKDVYVEKPIAIELDDLNQSYDVVKASDRIVQSGSQGRSSAGAIATKQFIQSGKLGKILRIEESRSHYNPYWNNYENPASEDETNWSLFLFNRPYRPFDPDQHGAWMAYLDFSNGTIGGWMSHMSDFVHYITGCGFPKYAVSQGGIYSPTSKPGRTCPDTNTAILEYEEGFTTLFTTHFGNAANDYMLIFGTKGTMRLNDPDGNSGGINPRVTGFGSDHQEKLGPEEITLEEIPQDDHMTNWVKCLRSRQQPNANIEAGYMQGVAVILADRALVEGRKMTYDPIRREIIPA